MDETKDIMDIAKPQWLEQMEGILETLNEGVLIAYAEITFSLLTEMPHSSIAAQKTTQSSRGSVRRHSGWAAEQGG